MLLLLLLLLVLHPVADIITLIHNRECWIGLLYDIDVIPIVQQTSLDCRRQFV